MFEKAVNLILEREGVFSNDKDDSGGETKYGITKKVYPHLDIPNLTKQQAIEIYRRDYWEGCSCHSMPWWAALLVFDAAVQHGQPTARPLIQRAVKVAADGKIGPISIRAIIAADADEAIGTFQALRFTDIYLRHSKWEKFGTGWLRRNFIVTSYAKIDPLSSHLR